MYSDEQLSEGNVVRERKTVEVIYQVVKIHVKDQNKRRVYEAYFPCQSRTSRS